MRNCIILQKAKLNKMNHVSLQQMRNLIAICDEHTSNVDVQNCVFKIRTSLDSVMECMDYINYCKNNKIDMLNIKITQNDITIGCIVGNIYSDEEDDVYSIKCKLGYVSQIEEAIKLFANTLIEGKDETYDLWCYEEPMTKMPIKEIVDFEAYLETGCL